MELASCPNLKICCLSGKRHSSIPSIRPTFWNVSYPTETQVREFLEPRMKECLLTHQNCRLSPGPAGDQGSNHMPTRLIMLENNLPPYPACEKSRPPFRLRLVDTSSKDLNMGEDTRYVALSHCWGPNAAERVDQTTKQTLEVFEKSISWDDLCLTFRDAITVTASIGARFIWIDTFCIIQDDRNDWVRQGAQMALVYQNAWLTIAATEAAHGGQGLFLGRSNSPPRRQGVHEIKVPGSSDPILVRTYPVFLYKLLHWTVEKEPDVPLPLMRRGWALQERICSTRIMHFTEKELVFECCSGSSCECESRVDKYHYRFKQRGSLLSDNPRFELNSWYGLVQQYMQCHLTHEVDRLPALSGVVNLVRNTFTTCLGRYLAGLWENDLLHGLHWEARRPAARRTLPCLAYGEIPLWIPSWSWASVGCADVRWPQEDLQEYIVEVDSSSPPSCSTSTKDGNGIVNGGQVTLRGRYCPVTIERDKVTEVHFGKEAADELSPSFSQRLENLHVVGERYMLWRPDTAADLDSTASPACFLPLSRLSATVCNAHWVHGLVLTSNFKSDEVTDLACGQNAKSHGLEKTIFSRVGFLQVEITGMMKDWAEETDGSWRENFFQKCGEEQIITIV